MDAQHSMLVGRAKMAAEELRELEDAPTTILEDLKAAEARAEKAESELEKTVVELKAAGCGGINNVLLENPYTAAYVLRQKLESSIAVGRKQLEDADYWRDYSKQQETSAGELCRTITGLEQQLAEAQGKIHSLVWNKDGYCQGCGNYGSDNSHFDDCELAPIADGE